MTKNWRLAARWWASDYAYAVRGQTRGLFTAFDSSTMHKGERAPVIVIPGIYESWRFLLPLITQVHERGHPIHVVESLQLNLRPVSESASLVKTYIESNDLSGAIILAHSKGGLIGKHVMMQSDAIGRVNGMVAVATPFGGSAYARFMVTRSLRIFSPNDPTIRALASDVAVNSRIVSIYGAFDPHIPARSELVGAKNVELDTGGHFRVLAHPRILAEFVELADRQVRP